MGGARVGPSSHWDPSHERPESDLGGSEREDRVDGRRPPITAAGSGRVRASRDGSFKGPEGTVAPGLFFPKGVEIGADPSELLAGALRCC